MPQRFNLPYTGTAPTRKHEDDAGLDLRAKARVHIPAGGTVSVGTGTSVAIPTGCVGLLFARSSLHRRFPGVRLANGVGVIDAGYKGEIIADLTAGDRAVTIPEGERIVQLVIVPIVRVIPHEVDHLGDSERGTGGFGSTGVH